MIIIFVTFLGQPHRQSLKVGSMRYIKELEQNHCPKSKTKVPQTTYSLLRRLWLLQVQKSSTRSFNHTVHKKLSDIVLSLNLRGWRRGNSKIDAEWYQNISCAINLLFADHSSTCFDIIWSALLPN